jgi:hypothetical protein
MQLNQILVLQAWLIIVSSTSILLVFPDNYPLNTSITLLHFFTYLANIISESDSVPKIILLLRLFTSPLIPGFQIQRCSLSFEPNWRL